MVLFFIKIIKRKKKRRRKTMPFFNLILKDYFLPAAFFPEVEAAGFSVAASLRASSRRS